MDAPLFHPTMKEFMDFEAFVASVDSLPEVQACGVFRVKPPEGWSARKDKTELPNITINAPVSQGVKRCGVGGLFQMEHNVEDAIDMNSFWKRSALRNAQSSSSSTRNPAMCTDWDSIERRYWKELTQQPPAVYGSDCERSLFDAVKDNNVWNLRKLPSLLSALKSPVPGVNTPFVYFGTWKSSFGWHTEDQNMYSINYLHSGAPKFWYFVPPGQALRFEAFCRDKFYELAQICPSFLCHKTTIVSAITLRAQGFNITRVVQTEGQFVVTLPHAYHSGFNAGDNIAEAVNFTTPRWLPFVERAPVCRCPLGYGFTFNMDIFKNQTSDDIDEFTYVNIRQAAVDAPLKKTKKKTFVFGKRKRRNKPGFASDDDDSLSPAKIPKKIPSQAVTGGLSESRKSKKAKSDTANTPVRDTYPLRHRTTVSSTADDSPSCMTSSTLRRRQQARPTLGGGGDVGGKGAVAASSGLPPTDGGQHFLHSDQSTFVSKDERIPHPDSREASLVGDGGGSARDDGVGGFGGDGGDGGGGDAVAACGGGAAGDGGGGGDVVVAVQRTFASDIVIVSEHTSLSDPPPMLQVDTPCSTEASRSPLPPSLKEVAFPPTPACLSQHERERSLSPPTAPARLAIPGAVDELACSSSSTSAIHTPELAPSSTAVLQRVSEFFATSSTPAQRTSSLPPPSSPVSRQPQLSSTREALLSPECSIQCDPDISRPGATSDLIPPPTTLRPPCLTSLPRAPGSTTSVVICSPTQPQCALPSTYTVLLDSTRTLSRSSDSPVSSPRHRGSPTSSLSTRSPFQETSRHHAPSAEDERALPPMPYNIPTYIDLKGLHALATTTTSTTTTTTTTTSDRARELRTRAYPPAVTLRIDRDFVGQLHSTMLSTATATATHPQAHGRPHHILPQRVAPPQYHATTARPTSTTHSAPSPFSQSVSSRTPATPSTESTLLRQHEMSTLRLREFLATSTQERGFCLPRERERPQPAVVGRRGGVEQSASPRFHEPVLQQLSERSQDSNPRPSPAITAPTLIPRPSPTVHSPPSTTSPTNPRPSPARTSPPVQRRRSSLLLSEILFQNRDEPR